MNRLSTCTLLLSVAVNSLDYVYFQCKEYYICIFIFIFLSFLEQRLLALEARYGKELLGLQSEKQQLQDLVERQSQLVSQLQGELGSSTLNSTTLQRQQAVLTDTVQQLLTKVSQCNGKDKSHMRAISGHNTYNRNLHCRYSI